MTLERDCILGSLQSSAHLNGKSRSFSEPGTSLCGPIDGTTTVRFICIELDERSVQTRR